MNTDNKIKSLQRTDDEQSKIHQEDMGFTLPDDFFAISRNEILKQTVEKEVPKINWYKSNTILWKIAASFVLFLGIFAIYNSANNSPFQDENKTLIASNENNFENVTYADSSAKMTNNSKELSSNYERLSTKKDQNLNSSKMIENDVLVQSLFVEEKEVDQYIDNYILEDI